MTGFDMTPRLYTTRYLAVMTMLVILHSGDLSAQEPVSEATVGYLRISVDTDLVDVYLDGVVIGYSPIPEDIAVIPGWHNLSFFSPDFRWEHWTHRQRQVLAEVVEAGTYRIFIEPGEVEEVQMEWHDLEQTLLRVESGRWISATVGVGMVAVVLLILTMAS